MHFIVTGFTPDAGFRVFAFEGIAADQTRTEFTVRADLSLIRRYGIRVQELKLLCRGVLEHRDEGKQERTFTFTEEEMRMHADSCAADQDATEKRKSRRRIVHHRIGGGWQVPHEQESPDGGVAQPANHLTATAAGQA